MSDLLLADATSLLAAAREVRNRAYARYSDFKVGAALLDDSGTVHLGANVENAAYPLATCAERSAVSRAVSEGSVSFRAIAIAGPNGVTCMPCGSCRQILFEFSPDIEVITEAASGGIERTHLGKLLPRAFGPSNLDENRNPAS